MSLRRFSLSAAAALTFAALGTGLVLAADLDPAELDPALLDPPQVMPTAITNAVFGTGWYVRGDFGGTQLLQANPTTQGILSINPTAIFHSYAPGVNFTPSHEIGYTASLGGGYSFNQWIRSDVVIDINQPSHSSTYGSPFPCQNGFGPIVTTTTATTTTSTSSPTYGTCSGNYQASLNSYDALVNGYVDVGTWHNVTPYIGAGVGLSFGNYQTSATYTQADGRSYNIKVTNPASAITYHLNFNRSGSGQYHNPAFALMGGFAIGIYDHVKLDIGYRYVNLGDISGRNVGQQEVRAGLRYMIDN